MGIERIAAEHVLDGKDGLPAATEPISGNPSCSTRADAPRGAGFEYDAALLASALRCSSAAFGEAKPKAEEISARVGGARAPQGVADEVEGFPAVWGKSFVVMAVRSCKN